MPDQSLRRTMSDHRGLRRAARLSPPLRDALTELHRDARGIVHVDADCEEVTGRTRAYRLPRLPWAPAAVTCDCAHSRRIDIVVAAGNIHGLTDLLPSTRRLLGMSRAGGARTRNLVADSLLHTWLLIEKGDHFSRTFVDGELRPDSDRWIAHVRENARLEVSSLLARLRAQTSPAAGPLRVAVLDGAALTRAMGAYDPHEPWRLRRHLITSPALRYAGGKVIATLPLDVLAGARWEHPDLHLVDAGPLPDGAAEGFWTAFTTLLTNNNLPPSVALSTAVAIAA